MHSKRWFAVYVEFALIIRLLIRLPMRQRCIREMLLGRNLYQDHAGVWQIRFVGTELKVASRRGQTNRYEFPFPQDLVPLLEEWLKDWRPKVAGPDETHVFVNARGKPYIQSKGMSDTIARADLPLYGHWDHTPYHSGHVGNGIPGSESWRCWWGRSAFREYRADGVGALCPHLEAQCRC